MIYSYSRYDPEPSFPRKVEGYADIQAYQADTVSPLPQTIRRRVDGLTCLGIPERYGCLRSSATTDVKSTVSLLAPVSIQPQSKARPAANVDTPAGFIPSTSLSRASSFSTRLLMSYVLHFMPFASTVEEGGNKVYQASLEAIPALEHGDRDRTAVYLKDHAA
jgi:hypothetical protein